MNRRMIHFHEIDKHLKIALQGTLPGEASHKKMLPPERDLSYAPEEKINVKSSSVLILLYQEGKELYTCLMKRPITMKYHPGQISFPGGRVEKQDKDEIHTALREAEEEIGLSPSSVEVLGQLSKLYISVSRFEIKPVIAFAKEKPDLLVNPIEVEKLYYFPVLEHLKLKEYAITTIKTSNGELKVPCIYFNDEIIWGATAMILSELFDLLKNMPIFMQE